MRRGGVFVDGFVKTERLVQKSRGVHNSKKNRVVQQVSWKVSPRSFLLSNFSQKFCTRTAQSGFVPHLTFLVQNFWEKLERRKLRGDTFHETCWKHVKMTCPAKSHRMKRKFVVMSSWQIHGVRLVWFSRGLQSYFFLPGSKTRGIQEKRRSENSPMPWAT